MLVWFGSRRNEVTSSATVKNERGWGSIGDGRMDYRLRGTISNRPKKSGFSAFAAAHGVGSCCFLFVASCRVFACFTCVFVADAVAMRPTVVPIVTIVVVVTAKTRIVVLVGAAEL